MGKGKRGSDASLVSRLGSSQSLYPRLTEQPSDGAVVGCQAQEEGEIVGCLAIVPFVLVSSHESKGAPKGHGAQGVEHEIADFGGEIDRLALIFPDQFHQVADSGINVRLERVDIAAVVLHACQSVYIIAVTAEPIRARTPPASFALRSVCAFSLRVEKTLSWRGSIRIASYQPDLVHREVVPYM